MSLKPFHNEPVLELRRATVRSSLADSLAALDRDLPLSVPVMVGDTKVPRSQLLSTDPGQPERVVAQAAAATAAEVDAALERSKAGFTQWKLTPVAERAAVLLRAAETLRRNRLRSAALILRECAKPWPEADADVCEAIDFLEFYARGAIELDRGIGLLQVAGERNELTYHPRGTVAVISPWNFPLAIPCGMVSAALATGNAVILKPAEQSPGCAGLLVETLRNAGVPPDALALLPGEGTVGAQLVKDPRVQTIAFTGSVAVGLEIIRATTDITSGQKQLKRVVAEMGGKNCIIVDSDCDLDDAVPAIIKSAFNYAGQKCSAAARVLVHEGIYDTFVDRLAGAIEALEVGPAEHLSSDVPPVIERAAQERIDHYVETGAKQGTILAAGTTIPTNGWYVAPTALGELPSDSKVLSDEIFGPVLAVERVSNIAEACDLVDASHFGLTGGIFARNPRTVQYVAGRSPVGNLYVNREITGAMVGRQPFGGNRLSGTGTKAGGPGYLLQFVEPHVVTENTMRHGLVM